MEFLVRFFKRFGAGHDIDLDAIDISTFTILARCAQVMATPKSSLLVADMADGSKIRGRNRAGFGGRGIFIFREAIEPELALLGLILRPGDCFIDVGACIGSYTITAANLIKDEGGVVAIDPNPDSMAILRDTIALNKLKNVLLICAAASNTVGFTQFSDEAERPRPDTRRIDDSELARANDMHRIVPTTTVDHSVGGSNLPGPVRMMKIDAEGAEPLVLKGARETIDRFRPVLILETGISDIPQLPGFVALRKEGSRNTVMVHETDSSALATLKERTSFVALN